MATKYQTPETIQSIEDIDMSAKYSYADYLLWRFEERVEIIKGKVYKMAAAPARKHQGMLVEISGQLYNHLRKSTCHMYVSPFDVRLPVSADNKKTFTVVQPDICIICDPVKLDEKGCNGAPDFIVEILSPSTAEKDAIIKFDLYEEVGVREYWIFYPDLKLVDVFVLNETGKYQFIKKYSANQKVPLNILEGCEIDLKMVFKE